MNTQDRAPVVGKLYEVPCILVQGVAKTMWMPRDGWVPVLGPKHDDAEHLMFPHQHFHVDWRFIPQQAYEYALRRMTFTPHGIVVSNDGSDGPGCSVMRASPVLKVRRMRREMPVHPPVSAFGGRYATGWQALEAAQAATCNRLKPGNICPHRGIDLTPFEQPDGTAVCPGHGLRWNLRTGELLPHHLPATGANG